MKKLNIKRELNSVEQDVVNFVNDRASEYNNGVEGVFEDIFTGGCQSGFVNHLIYYNDTHAYFDEHYDAVQDALDEYKFETGENFNLNKNGDIKNLGAWFVFEWYAQRLACEAGINI